MANSLTGYSRLTGHFLPKTRPQDHGRLRNNQQLWPKTTPTRRGIAKSFSFSVRKVRNIVDILRG